MAVSMRTGQDGLAVATPIDERWDAAELQEARHRVALVALRRRLAEEAGPVGGTLARAAMKRGFDLTIALAMLVVALPILVLVAVAIKLDSPGPVFYRARRIGHRGRPLTMFKFRKMRDDAAGPALTMDDDNRFTRVGEWLAKTKLDEMPQLINVRRGEVDRKSVG